MSDTFPLSLSSARAHLERGQAHEARGDPTAALLCYDTAIAELCRLPSNDLETRRQLGIAWMNRGNALQKKPVPPSATPTDGVNSSPSPSPAPLDRPISKTLPHQSHPLLDSSFSVAESVAAYDRAVALFETLPFWTEPGLRNHLGAAWLNRGRALIASTEPTPAVDSFERAIYHLERLPVDANPFYRLNLAGAWSNLAHVQLPTLPARSRLAAQQALALLREVEIQTPAFAEMSLRARRTLTLAVGQLLTSAERHESRDPSRPALVAEASDALDDGLALARSWEAQGVVNLRPLALRLFYLGAQLYRIYQPHFLAEFLLENLLPSAAFAGLPEFLQVADDALHSTLVELQRPRHLVMGSPESEQLLTTVQSLRDARAQLSLPSSVISAPPLVPSA